MKTVIHLSQAPEGARASALPASRPGWPVQVAGLLGAAVIGGTLATVRLWARLTRTPYHKD